MADIDTVLERLVTDAAFRDRLGSDPAAALAGYDLTADDLQLLASSLDDTDSGQRGVEQRTSKSAVLGLLASLTGGGGGGTGELRDPPRLDGASKDTAYLGNAAPGGETEAAFTKFDDIKGEATEAPDDATELRKVSGQKKYNNIVLKRGADTSRTPLEEFAPADPDGGEPSTAFKQGFPVKWQGANVAPGDGDVPPVGTDEAGDAARAWPKKIEYGSLKAGDTSASEAGLSGTEEGDPARAGDFDGDGRTDLGSGPAPTGVDAPGAREMTTGLDVEESATTPPEDFLTIEDE